MLVSPILIFIAIASIWFGYVGIFVALFLSVLIHEYAHILVASHYGVKISRLNLLPFGAMVEIESKWLPQSHRILILLAGPLANIFIAFIFSSLVWIAPSYYPIFQTIIIANLIPGILNLLPILPFDGGKIIEIISGNKATTRIMQAVSITSFAAITIYGIVTISIFFIIFGATLALTNVMEMCVPASANNLSGRNIVRVGEIYEVAVNADTTLMACYKALSKTNYTRFNVIGRGTTFTETDLENMLLAHTATTQLSAILF